jgi:hypothetical protein
VARLPCALPEYNVAGAGAHIEKHGHGTSRPVVAKRRGGLRAGAGRAGRWTGLMIVAAFALGVAGCGGRAPSGHLPPAKARRARGAPSTDPAAVLARAHVPVLCWHQIREPMSTDSADALPYIVSPRRLAEQLDALDRAGFTAVGGDALASHVLRGTPLPHKPVLLTFDDGCAGQYTPALPILRRHHFVATCFVMTVVLESRDGSRAARCVPWTAPG